MLTEWKTKKKGSHIKTVDHDQAHVDCVLYTARPIFKNINKFNQNILV